MNPLPFSRTTKPCSVLFDLDGTLADTAPDLALALNRLRKEEGLAPLPYELIRAQVSHGGTALLRLGFSCEPGDPGFVALRQRFLELYQKDLATHTRLFPGMDVVLETLERQGIGWGVVTNKPSWLTDPLMEQLALAKRAGSIVSGDTLPQSKPHPAPLLHACRQMEVSPANCLYVGDALRDIEAGRAAGMETLVALFGYLGNEDRPEQWGADGMVETPLDILSHLNLSQTGEAKETTLE